LCLPGSCFSFFQDTAKNLIEDDTYYNISILKKGASHAYAPASSYCCKCGRALDKESFGSSICIFHCGHATHFQCETQDPKTPSKDSSSGCPICIPKKRSSPARNKMKAVWNKNVKVPSNTMQIQALSAKSTYENAITERPYGLHQQSRVDLLWFPYRVSEFWHIYRSTEVFVVVCSVTILTVRGQ
jgi:hypothetical protein